MAALTRAALVALCLAGVNAAPITSSTRAVKGSIQMTMDKAYAQQESQGLFLAMQDQLSRALAVNTQSVLVEEMIFSDSADRRRMQTGSDVEILYTVQCTTDCASLKSDMTTKLDTTAMTNVMNTIDNHAQDSGFTSVVQSTAADMAAAAAAAAPSFVDIIIPSCPPGMETHGAMTRTELITAGASACYDIDGCKDSPCGAKCTDIAAPLDGYTCGNCASGSGVVPTDGASPNDECTTKTGGTVPCRTGLGSGGDNYKKHVCLDINDCSKTNTGPPTGPCGWNGVTCTDVSTSLKVVSPTYSCTCKYGYTFTQGVCKQSNPCALNPCKPTNVGKCTTVAVSADALKADPHTYYSGFTCSCTPAMTAVTSSLPAPPLVPAQWAWKLSGTDVCTDIDACAPVNPCFAGVKCYDEMAPAAGYVCKHDVTGSQCPPGFKAQGLSCVDIDDCANDPCSTAKGFGTCKDLGPISFECKCTKGYQFANGGCEVVKPCNSFDANDCDALATCNDIGDGAHTCTCKQSDVDLGYRERAYTGDGHRYEKADAHDRILCGKTLTGTFPGGSKTWIYKSTSYNTLTVDACLSGVATTVEIREAGSDDVIVNEKINIATFGKACKGETPKLKAGTYTVSVMTGSDAAAALSVTSSCGTGGGTVVVPKGCTDFDGCDSRATHERYSSGSAVSPCFTPVDHQGTPMSPLACKDGSAALVIAGGAPHTCGACPSGYQVGGSGEAWECNNVGGKRSWACVPGDKTNGKPGCEDANDCSPVNPCGVDPTNQEAAGTCADTGRNSYACTCKKGFRTQGSPATCIQINPCAAGESSDCDDVSKCVHTGPGTHRCDCPSGASTGDGRLSGTTGGCVNVDKCDCGKDCYKCGVGLNKVLFTPSITPCTDANIANDTMGQEYWCRAGCPQGTVDAADPADKTMAGRTCTDIDDCLGKPQGPCTAGLPNGLYDKSVKCQDMGATSYQCACPKGMQQIDSTLGRVCASSCSSGIQFESYDETDPTKVYTASTLSVNNMGMWGSDCGQQVGIHHEAVYAAPLKAGMAVLFKTNTSAYSLSVRFQANSVLSIPQCEAAEKTTQCNTGADVNEISYTATADGFVYFVLSNGKAEDTFGTLVYESASCSAALDLTQKTSPQSVKIPSAAISSTVVMACSAGGATTSRSVAKFLVPAGSTFVFSLTSSTDPNMAASMRAGGDTCAGGAEVACLKDNDIPMSWENTGGASYAYVFFEGAFGAAVDFKYEIDTDDSVCDGIVDLDKEGGNTKSSFMKVHPSPMPTCVNNSITSKKTAEEVFKINVPVGVAVRVVVTKFKSSVGSKALIDARWGGACVASTADIDGGAGTNKVLCAASVDNGVVEWKNDQDQAQPLFITLEPAGNAADTTAQVIGATYSLQWTKFSDACVAAADLPCTVADVGCAANGKLLSSTSPPPAWATAYAEASTCHAAKGAGFREMLYTMKVPAGMTATLRLTSESSESLIMEGRFGGANDDCPGKATAFCGKSASYTTASNSWTNSGKDLMTLYVMIEEEVKGTSSKPFKLDGMLSMATLKCEAVQLPEECISQHCEFNGVTRSVSSETTGHNFFKTACCTDGTDCGEEKVYAFTVPPRATLQVKAITGGWLSKYELRANGACAPRAGGKTPGTDAVPTGSCFATGKTQSKGDWLSYTNNPSIKTCMDATLSLANQAQINQLCLVYGVRQAAFLTCKSLALDDATCTEVGNLAVKSFGAGKSAAQCAAESTRMSQFCSTVAALDTNTANHTAYLSIEGATGRHGGSIQVMYKYTLENVDSGCDGTLKGLAAAVELKNKPTEVWVKPCIGGEGHTYQTYAAATGGVCKSKHEGQTTMAKANARCDNPSQRSSGLRALVCKNVAKYPDGKYYWCSGASPQTVATYKGELFDTGKCKVKKTPGKTYYAYGQAKKAKDGRVALDAGTTHLAGDQKSFTDEKFQKKTMCWYRWTYSYASLSNAKTACNKLNGPTWFCIGLKDQYCDGRGFMRCAHYTVTRKNYRRLRRYGKRMTVSKTVYANSAGYASGSMLDYYWNYCTMWKSKAKTTTPAYCPPSKDCVNGVISTSKGIPSSSQTAFPAPGCGFEAGACGWATYFKNYTAYTAGYKNVGWKIGRQGRTPSGGTGPQKANSGRKYAFFEASYPAYIRRNNYGKITSPVFTQGKFKDMSFETHAYGSSIGTFSVSLLVVSTQYRSGRWQTGKAGNAFAYTQAGQKQTTYTSKWDHHKVVLPATAKRLRFSLTGNSGYAADFSLDTVSFPANDHPECTDQRVRAKKDVAYVKGKNTVYKRTSTGMSCLKYGPLKNECAGITSGKCAHGSWTPKQYHGYYPAYRRYSEDKSATSLKAGPAGDKFINIFTNSSAVGSVQGKCVGVNMQEPGKYAIRGVWYDNDVISKFTGFGIMHKIIVMQGARLQYGVFRRSTTFNYAVTVRTTGLQTTDATTGVISPQCEVSTFENCWINGDTAFKNLGKTASKWMHYPNDGKATGATESKTVYITIQTESTAGSLGGGYYLRYKVCKANAKGQFGGADGVLCPANGKF